MNNKISKLLLVVMVVFIALSACGRKGDLYHPSSSANSNTNYQI